MFRNGVLTYSFNVLDLPGKTNFLMQLYDVQYNNIKVKWSRNQTGDLYRDGYKYCSNCEYMIKTLVYFCKVCGRKFRFNKLGKKSKPFTESKNKPVTFYLNGDKDV